MTQEEFNKLKFSDRHELSRATVCEASWQVRQHSGAYAIACRKCGTLLQSGCTPKCLLNESK